MKNKLGGNAHEKVYYGAGRRNDQQPLHTF